ncbi:MAG TPA: glycoside hydrolase family 30 beta sandwich domain-containing protein [Prolixibacteraceae bacterium]|nr:glycoside hydrolase family 30 beta sandwich domain-containing protein [Prolixibacteraceae bacterium]
MRKILLNTALATLAGVSSLFAQQAGPVSIEAWVTNGDRSTLFEKQAETVSFSDRDSRRGAAIVIDENQPMQLIDGFGFALTGGSAELMMKMSATERNKLIRELFDTDENNVGISYIRLSIGASDLNSFVFSYNDLKEGETDLELKKFDLFQDYKDVIPVMKEILAINPRIKILGSPWSAPAWMKTNNNVRGGALKPEYYNVYARYFVKYIEAMKKEGITIDAITVQNEPLNSRNTPSMQWHPAEQRDFIKNHLGPEFQKANITAKVILFDHNLDRIDYPLTTLSDPEAAKYIDGSGFHHYGGDMSAMTILHTARPDKHIYFTEQMVVEKPGSPTIEIAAQVKRLIIGASRNWSKNVILWNFAADPLNDPHTDNGGCSMCQGAVTLDGDKVSRNLAYYTIAHASKFVRPGSVRIASTTRGDRSVSLTEDEERAGAVRVTVIENSEILPNVAFKTPEGKTVLIVANDTYSTSSFRIQYNGQFANLRLNPGAVGTYVW